MNPIRKKRVIRKVVASLIDAGFTNAELGDIAESFVQDSMFQRDLADVIRRATAIFQPNETLKEPPNLGELTEVQRRWIQHIQEIVKRRRMSKTEIVDLFAGLDPRRAETIDANATLREMLVRMAKTGSVGDLEAIVRVLEPSTDDPYLKGIMQRGVRRS